MSKEPVSKKDERDHVFASFYTKISTISNEKERKDLGEQFTQIIDTIYLADEDRSFEIYQNKQRKKTFYKVLLGFIIGVAVAILPSFLHIHYIEKALPSIPFKYVPNSEAYKKPAYVQAVVTDEDVKKVKASHIRDFNLVSKGAVIKLGEIGLSVIPKDEAQSPDYHFKWAGVQKALVKEVNGFRFEPDTLFTQDPIQLQVIKTENEVRAAGQQKWLNNKNLLEVGAAVHCPQKGNCFTMAKSTLQKEYRKVVPIIDAK